MAKAQWTWHRNVLLTTALAVLGLGTLPIIIADRSLTCAPQSRCMASQSRDSDRPAANRLANSRVKSCS